MMCSYQGVEATITKLEALKGKVVGTVKYIQSLVKETTDDIFGCFGVQHSAFLSSQNDLIQMNC